MTFLLVCVSDKAAHNKVISLTFCAAFSVLFAAFNNLYHVYRFSSLKAFSWNTFFTFVTCKKCSILGNFHQSTQDICSNLMKNFKKTFRSRFVIFQRFHVNKKCVMKTKILFLSSRINQTFGHFQIFFWFFSCFSIFLFFCIEGKNMNPNLSRTL